MRKHITYILLALGLNVQAQVSTAEGATMINELNSPVNLSTGVASIQVPILSLPHFGGHNVPVSLNYQTTGHRVQDVAGNVGLGWTLHAGGAIVRAVRGLPDGNGTSTSDWEAISNGDKDGERDLFYFTFPGGDGIFVLDLSFNGGFPRTLPASEYKIEYSGSYSDIKNNTTWIITDGDGNKYYYGYNSAVESITSNTSEPDGTHDSLNDLDYTSIWYLTKIELYGNPYDIDFHYNETAPSYSYKYYDGSIVYTWSDSGITFEESIINNRITINNPRYLSSIESSMGTVEFNYGSNREDIGEKYLSSIKLQDESDNQISEFKLNHNYFNSSDSYSEIRLDGQTHDLQDVKRLKLVSIDRMLGSTAIGFREFDYANDKEFALTEKFDDLSGNEYSYDVKELPPRDSHTFDYLGFNNNSDIELFTGAGITLKRGYPTLHISNASFDFLNLGTNKMPDEDGVLANMLTKITYPNTGAYTEYDYEVNNLGGQNVGGVRVDKVTQYESLDNSISYMDYNYLDGNTLGTYLFSYSYHRAIPSLDVLIRAGNYVNLDPFWTSGRTTSDNGPLSFEYIDIPSVPSFRPGTTILRKTSITPVVDFNGSHVEYSDVDVVTEKGGRTNYQFYTASDTDVQDEAVYIHRDWTSISGVVGDVSGFRNGAPIYSPNTTRFWFRNNTKSKTIYNSANEPLSKVSYHYDLDEPVTTHISNYRSSYFSQWDNAIWYRYEYDIMPVELEFVRNYLFDNLGSPQLQSEVNYQYDNTVAEYELEAVQTTYADGSQYRTENHYPDVIGNAGSSTPVSDDSEALRNLTFDNIGFRPVEVVNKFRENESDDYLILSASVSTYKKYSSLDNASLPYQQYSFTSASPLPESEYVVAFTDASGNLQLDLSDQRLEITSTTESASNALEVTHHDWNGNFSKQVFDSRGYLQSQGFNESNLDEKNTYQYESLVGLKSSDDLNDNTISYEYDNRNRLHLIRDKDNNILERYRYNFSKEDNSTMSADIEIQGIISGSPTTFTATNISAYGGEGNTTFNWDLGGTLIADAGSEVTHTFTTSGPKSITLEMSNPEYENNGTESTSVIIYSCSNAIQNSSITENASGGSRTVSVVGPFVATGISDNASWITSPSVAPDGKSISYSFDPNTLSTSRNGTITVTISGCASNTITVTQSAGSGGGCGCSPSQLDAGCICIPPNGCACF